MANRLPENVYSTLLEALPADRPISREDFRRYDVPESIAHFLQHALDRRLELETARIMDLARGWVDHDREEIALARSAYLRLLGRYAHYPTAEWPRALRQAVQLVCAYLIRPVPTLIHFVFGEKRPELGSADVERRMDYFIGFQHLRTAVAAFVERQPGQTVSRRALSEALEAVDRQICHEYTIENWKTLVTPLADLGHRTPTKALSLNLLTRFFESRGGSSVAAGVSGYARARSLTSLTRDQLDAALLLVGAPNEYHGSESGAGELTLVAGTSVPEVQVSEPEPPGDHELSLGAGPESALEPDVRRASIPTREPMPREASLPPEPLPEPRAAAQPVAPNYSDDAASEAEPLWQRYRSDSEDAPQTTESASPAHQADDQPLWKKFQNSLDTGPAEVPPLKSRSIRLHPTPIQAPERQPVVDRSTLEFAVLGPAAWQRDAFIERVFNDSTELYFEALARLDSSREWRSAADFIAVDVFRANRVNIYDEAAIDFTNAVEAQFKRR